MGRRSRPGTDADTDPAADRDAKISLSRVVSILLRTFLIGILVVALAFGTLLFAPTIVEELDELEDQPSPSSDPPTAGDRDPDRTDPDDPGSTAYETDVETVTSEAVEDFVHAEVNDRRGEHGLDPLEWDGTVASVSRAHSADMHEREYFDHTNPDGESPYDRFERTADYCQYYGENLAMNWLDQPVEEPESSETREYQTAEGIAEGLVEQWMNSPDHRDAIIEADQSHSWDRGGVGVYISEDGAVYATHNFCTEW